MTIGTTIETDDGLAATLVRQRAAFLRDGPPPLADRRSDLMRLKNALRAHREDFVAAINTDFGHRSRQETSLFDLASVVEGINFCTGISDAGCSQSAGALPCPSGPPPTGSSISRSASSALYRLGTILLRWRSCRLRRPWQPAIAP